MIYCEFVVKIMCTYRKEKKRKKKKKMEWNCGNGIVEIGGKKNIFPPISALPLPQIDLTFFF